MGPQFWIGAVSGIAFHITTGVGVHLHRRRRIARRIAEGPGPGPNEMPLNFSLLICEHCGRAQSFIANDVLLGFRERCEYVGWSFTQDRIRCPFHALPPLEKEGKTV